MMKIEINLTRLKQCDALQNIADALMTSVDNETIVIPPQYGEGTIQKKDLAEGFSVFYWDIRLHQSAELKKLAGINGSKIFSLIYIFTPDFFLLNDVRNSEEFKKDAHMHILMDAVDRDLNFTLSRGQQIKVMAISMDATWLTREFENTGIAFQCLLHDLIHNVQPAVIYGVADQQEYKTVTELHEHFKEGSKEPFYIKAKAMLLMSGFFHNLFLHRDQHVNNSMPLYQEKMSKVEEILQAHINDQLPSIKEIARVVALSESSLKRYFRIVYGTSIYDYYLHKKMEKAKQLLGESKLPVKEVAYSLGYERTSSFIRIFKKFYNFSPSLLHKMRIS